MTITKIIPTNIIDGRINRAPWLATAPLNRINPRVAMFRGD
jgi:hypothetical protein